MERTSLLGCGIDEGRDTTAQLVFWNGRSAFGVSLGGVFSSPLRGDVAACGLEL